jgi:hypothetical protein
MKFLRQAPVSKIAILLALPSHVQASVLAGTLWGSDLCCTVKTSRLPDRSEAWLRLSRHISTQQCTNGRRRQVMQLAMECSLIHQYIHHVDFGQITPHGPTTFP